MLITSVEVTRPIGSSTFARCHADMVEGFALVITSIDTEDEVRRVPVEDWRHVVVRDGLGGIVYEFDNPQRRAQVPHHPHPDAVKAVSHG